ncbi:MAG: hypothetical protein ACXQS8_04955 [Candidatus Helarchaeales archaeon]
MKIKLEDFGIWIDAKDWTHKYFKEFRRHVFRKNPSEPFPNLQVRVDKIEEGDLHAATDFLVLKIKESFSEPVEISEVEKIMLGEHPAISMLIKGIRDNEEDLLMKACLIHAEKKLIMFRFIFRPNQLIKYENEFKEIANSIEVLKK